MGGPAEVAEAAKHAKSDAACTAMGWLLIPLVGNAYGGWGPEAVLFFSDLAGRIARQKNIAKSVALRGLYGRMGTAMARVTGGAILARTGLMQGGAEFGGGGG